MDIHIALKHAKAAAKRGDKEHARAILKTVINHDPQNEMAFLMFATVAEKKEHAIYCLKQVLKINPNNQVAHNALKRFQAKPRIRKTTQEKKITLRMKFIKIFGLVIIFGFCIITSYFLYPLVKEETNELLMLSGTSRELVRFESQNNSNDHLELYKDGTFNEVEAGISSIGEWKIMDDIIDLYYHDQELVVRGRWKNDMIIDSEGRLWVLTEGDTVAVLSDANLLEITQAPKIIETPQSSSLYQEPSISISTIELEEQIMGGTTNVVAIQGDYAYLGVGMKLVILDVSNPSKPYRVGQTSNIVLQEFQGETKDIYISDNSAYLIINYFDEEAGESGYLWIVDIADPTQPIEIGRYDIPGESRSVFVSNHNAYIDNGNLGVLFLDLSNPEKPEELGLWLPQELIPNDEGEKDVIDITDPTELKNIHMDGSYAYISLWSMYTGWRGFRVVDFNNVSNPREIGGWIPQEVSLYVSDMFFSNYAYVAYNADDQVGFMIIDVSSPSEFNEIGVWLSPDLADSNDTISDIYVFNSYAYITCSDSSMRVIDISDPSNSKEVGVWVPPKPYADDFYSGEMLVSGSYAYITDQYFGLWIVDITDPTNPREVGTWGTIWGASDIFGSSSYIHVVDWNENLWALDLSNPSRPIEVGRYSLGEPSAFIISDPYLYFIDGSRRFSIANISDPIRPYIISSLRVGHIVDIFITKSYAFLADSNFGLRILDISDPFEPYEISRLQTFNGARGVFVSESYAYVTDKEGGLWVIDVSDLTQPDKIGYIVGSKQLDEFWYARNIAITKSYAFIVCDENGLWIVDISTPAFPQEIGYYNVSGIARSIIIKGNYAYITTREEEGLSIIDITNPSHPQEVISYDTPGGANQIFVSGDYVYVADGQGGLLVLRLME